VLKESEQGTVESNELQDHAVDTAGYLPDFQELKEKWEAKTKTPKGNQRDADSRLEIIRNLSGASSNLRAALLKLLHLQAEHAVEETIVNLTRRWEAAVKQDHREIANGLRELTGTGGLQDAIPNTKDWVGPWHLGAGSFGSAPMYAKLSNTGDIINRVVVKDCDHNQDAHLREIWNKDPSFFPLNDAKEKVPTEVLTMFDLKGKQGSE
jgi:hypothetical protein